MENRIIKFRAWDGGEMIPPDSVKFLVEFDGTVWENEGTYEHDYLKERTHIILMQFTGLKDKSGKEIYEGDVVRVFEHDIDENFMPTDRVLSTTIAEVVWDSERAGWCVFSEVFMDKIHPMVHLDAFEVIGNIYEHPHLLEPEKINQ